MLTSKYKYGKLRASSTERLNLTGVYGYEVYANYSKGYYTSRNNNGNI